MSFDSKLRFSMKCPMYAFVFFSLNFLKTNLLLLEVHGNSLEVHGNSLDTPSISFTPSSESCNSVSSFRNSRQDRTEWKENQEIDQGLKG